MAGPGLGESEAALRRLSELAAALVEPWARAAAARTTASRERAILRLLGVGGVDGLGRPLAAEVVDRYLAGGHARLGGGLLLPFVVAQLEYDLAPAALALEVASGAVDLGLEARLLDDPRRRAAAEAEATRLVAAGIDRVDANRIARRELIGVLGEAPRPWVGIGLRQPVAGLAAAEARAAVRAGANLVRVEVPSGRELAARLGAVGVEVKRWQPGAAASGAGQRPGDAPAGGPTGDDPAPSGSQRGLAQLRASIDEVALERPGYVRLAISPPALSAPEAAAVAVAERIDVVDSDPFEEIVTIGVDPDRALADHSFARRLHGLGGGAILVGAGPLVVAPDLARGVPSDPASRAGRALALQVLSAGLAAADGLSPARVFLGALPAWLLDENQPFARLAAEVAIRRALFPDHPLAMLEPVGSARLGSWAALIGALFPVGASGGLVLLGPSDDPLAAVTAGRRAVDVASDLREAWEPGHLRGTALAHAQAVLAAAADTLEGLAATGWEAILGVSPADPTAGLGRLGDGPDSVTVRADAFDPLADALVVDRA